MNMLRMAKRFTPLHVSSLFLSLFLLSISSFAIMASVTDELSNFVTISTGHDVFSWLSSQKKISYITIPQKNFYHSGVLLKIRESDVIHFTQAVHDQFHRCGGFFVHEDEKSGLKTLESFEQKNHHASIHIPEYLSEEDFLNQILPLIEEENIKQTILQLGQFHNRYYKSETGLKAFEWIKQNWESIAQGRNDISVRYFEHPSFPQKSVILTIEGSESPQDIIILGGHGDSISGFFNRQLSKAPGADDNASGISTLTEVLRVIVASQYRPKKTIQFMAYAAEEVGLLGSQDIAKDYKEKNRRVHGVLQLDMTNQQSGPFDIVLMSDFTSTEQNAFLGKLIDRYVHVPWGHSQCGYACSDHASWTKNGFAASIPFETTMDRSNRYIHTGNDTLASMGGTANHSVKFAKLALAYAVEMAK